MKKLLVGLIVGVLMSVGLVAATTSTSTAACPYTGCVATRFVVAKVWDSPRPGKVRAKWRVRTLGNAVPSGRVRVIIRGNGEYRSRSVPYPGNVARSFFRLNRGVYKVIFRFTPEPGTAFARSSAVRQVRVR